ncbi:MAG: alpha/beta hydrolase [Chloroflexi bacterium]|nr:alpha/beta hydrolase [Chloroflexota bacterium]
MTTGTLNVGGGDLYYETAGTGEALVLSHAAFLDSRMFDAQFEALARDYRVIRYDMRGFGRSSPATQPVCRREDLRQLLDHLGVERAHLVGCSMSGTLLLDLALEQPDQPLSLTVVGATPSGYELTGQPPRYVMEMIDALQHGDVARANELQIRIWLDGSYREPDQVDSALREKALAMNLIPVRQGTFFIADGQPACPLDPPAMDRLEDIRCPVLVVAGALEAPVMLEVAEMMAARLPNARKVVIDGAAHVPSYEKPEVFNPLLLGFLREAQPADA